MAALALAVLAGGQPLPDPVTWSLIRPATKSIVRGTTIDVVLRAAIGPGWHLYGLDLDEGGPISTEISLPAGQPFAFARSIRSSKPHEVFDPSFKMTVRLYTGRAEFVLPIAVAASAPRGRHTLTVETRYQSCNDRICLPPRTSKVTLTIDVRDR